MRHCHGDNPSPKQNCSADDRVEQCGARPRDLAFVSLGGDEEKARVDDYWSCGVMPPLGPVQASTVPNPDVSCVRRRVVGTIISPTSSQ